MGNLIYVIVIIAYFIFQYQQSRKKQQQQEEAKRRASSADHTDRKIPAPEPTINERMKDIFREIEMKNKPYARPDKTAAPKKIFNTSDTPVQKAVKQKPVKKVPTPFLNVDMTEEEVLPEGTASQMVQDAFAKDQVGNFDYNVIEKKQSASTFNLRQAMIGKIILERPEW